MKHNKNKTTTEENAKGKELVAVHATTNQCPTVSQNTTDKLPGHTKVRVEIFVLKCTSDLRDPALELLWLTEMNTQISSMLRRALRSVPLN